MIRYVYCLVIMLVDLRLAQGRILSGCRFAHSFYRAHASVFELDSNHRSLTVRPLYAFSNQSFSSINQSFSLGIIYRFADTYLVPVPLLFECPTSERLHAAQDCEFTIMDTRSDLSVRTSEPTRTSTVPLQFPSLVFHSLRGAYFKQSTVTLKKCRMLVNETLHLLDTFHLRIEFEQTVDSPCHEQCSHTSLYECSSLSKTCQCRAHELGVEKLGQLCVDTELGSNCSLTPARCRRLCRSHEQIRAGRLDPHCQCPLGTRRVRTNNIHYCQSPTLPQCDKETPLASCPKSSICRENRCVQLAVPVRLTDSLLSLPLILVGLLVGALFIIVLLILGLVKMRSIRCVKFVHPSHVISTSFHHSGHSSPATITRLSTVASSSSPCSTLSSSSKSAGGPLSSTTKIHLFE